MKQYLLAFVVLVSLAGSYAAPNSLREKRETLNIPREFQNINIDNYLKNERAVKFQLKCILDNGPCDRIGKYMKKTIPESLTNKCDGCDEATIKIAKRLAMHINEKFPVEWERLLKKFPVKQEDLDELEARLGVKIDPKFAAMAGLHSSQDKTDKEASQDKTDKEASQDKTEKAE